MIIHGENMSFRFTGDKYHSGRSLAYLIEPPTEPKYKPFESVEKAMKVIMAHGGWVKRKNTDDYYLVNGCHSFGNDLYIYIDPTPYNSTVFLGGFVFADDGSPCGELAEE